MFKRPDPMLACYLEGYISWMSELNGYDIGHDYNHTKQVIKNSMDIYEELLPKCQNLDINMIVTIASFHDAGIPSGRDNHHITGAKILLSDQFIQKVFSKYQIIIMKEAIEDHRASNKSDPRSIYGRIISTADRIIDPETVIKRSMNYIRTLNPNWSFEQCVDQSYRHISEKYKNGGGYAKIPLKTNRITNDLFKLNQLLDSITLFVEECKKHYPVDSDVTYEESNPRLEQYYRDNEEFGCGYWSVCLEHDCCCSRSAPVSQGFSEEVWNSMSRDKIKSSIFVFDELESGDIRKFEKLMSQINDDY